MRQEIYESIHDICEYTIRIGENAKDNWDIIDMSKQNDIWFHVSNHPSCHVILDMSSQLGKGTRPHKSVLNYCAALCKEGSKVKDVKNIKVIYTEIKNIKKGDKVGAVISKNENVIVV